MSKEPIDPNAKYIGNTAKKEVHKLECKRADKIKEENRVLYEDLEAAFRENMDLANCCLRSRH